MSKNRIRTCVRILLHLLLAAGCLMLPLFFFDISKDESNLLTQILLSFVEVAVFASSFTIAAFSFFISYEGSWVKEIKKRKAFSSLMRALKRALISFAVLLVSSIIGFFFQWAVYASFFIFGLSIGYYVGVVRIIVSVGEYEGKKAEQEEDKPRESPRIHVDLP